MKAWIACFVILFGLAELFLWITDFILPLPIYLLGGAFLAIASNREGKDFFSSRARENNIFPQPDASDVAKISKAEKVEAIQSGQNIP